ncbi:GMC family oxidoreductase [Streptomyces sp. NBC_01381]|uniref:GMC family oxidoreductase n=1 Tax=Streptomyces sp. NBC_01381 TaxID=2903845 RepID=UPI002259819A|nr:GMC family oxidoreductase [Streptomyces sp. NBC_01381]MCX4671652.1 GMC family oxidoreductase [Streptomyces sp. NBC_01381]
MTTGLTESQRAVLRAVCDTVVPRIERADDPDGFWRRTASDLGVDVALEQFVAAMPTEQRAGLVELLDGLAAQDFPRVSQLSREQILRTVAMLGSQAAAGMSGLVGVVLFLAYGAPDPQTGHNPNWRVFGYPGPISTPPTVPKPIQPLVPEREEVSYEADVCVVGSGAGGGVIAGELARRGLKVVVLEAGGHFTEADFNQLELPAYQNLYWRGGPQTTADGNVAIQAGACLGGGTTVNWTNCLRTHPWVREEWAKLGLAGLAGPEFDRHLDEVLRRSSATDRCSDLNGPQLRMRDGAERLGWSFRTVVRNADPDRYDPASAAYLGFGDQSGSKQGTLKTYLQDAFEHGADLLVRCRADRVLVERGRAAGVRATWSDPASGRRADVTVRASHVVVAGGALESPALLLRSRIGGPAVGNYLRLHPSTALFGVYGEDQRAWWGAPHAGLCDQFAEGESGHGFLIEGAQYAPALIGSALPFTTAAEHKQLMTKVRYGATSIGLLRDRGHGRVIVGPGGEPVVTYALTDKVDLRNSYQAIDAQARLHEAAGAREIFTLGAGAPRWQAGDALDEYLRRVRRLPLGAGGLRLFSAHQTGSCRMGLDPGTSVAGPYGELHDTPGVWIGDGSAFPTAAGTNPMVTIMALARRTAEAIADGPAALV